VPVRPFSAVGIDLSGQVAVVTGASSGIGRAIAERLGGAGAAVVVNSRSADRAEQTAQALRERGVDAHGVAADIGRDEQAGALVAAAAERYGRLDVLVNNAGQPSVCRSEDLAPADWRRVLDTDLSGAFYCAQAAAKVMLPQGSGVIVNISSIFGQTGNPRRAAYVAAKHGLDGLTKVLAAEWADRGVRVCSVNPAYVLTPLVEEAMAAGSFATADVERRTPAGRLGLPEEVAEVVTFLASPAASYLTGIALPVDGGWLAYGGL
jgi:3-oxoacyl-[acyl-carrier protein] reductase